MPSFPPTPPDHPPLQYPLGDARPATGEVLTLRPGLHWIRMALPFALDHINLWVLDDAQDGREGWTLIDSGVAIDSIRAAWQTLWTGPLKGAPLGRMLVTHMHPDHVGNAHWLIEHFSAAGQPARLWMSAGDFLAARLSCSQTLGFGGARAADYFAGHGLVDPHAQDKIRARGDYYASMVPQVPESYRRLQDGMTVDIGARRWRCIAGFGHSPEHIALYDETDRVLISGDMLLPRISTNISVTDMEPESDALGLFLASLTRFEALPPDTLVLPSHGLPFTGLHARIADLRQHHEDRLDDVRRVCRQSPACAADLLPVLFKRSLDLHQTTFAMGEAVAHLNRLCHAGELVRRRDEHGVWRFAPAAA